MKKFLILILLLILPVHTASAEAIFNVKVSGSVKKLNSSPTKKAFNINFPTPEGIHAFKFEQEDAKKYLAMSDSDEEAYFFKGTQTKVTIKGNNPLASADLEDGMLYVNFIGRRTGRTYMLSVDLTSNQPVLMGHLTHVSGAFNVACASMITSPIDLIPNRVDGVRTLLNRELTLAVEADNSFYKKFKKYKGKSHKVLSVHNTRKSTALDMRSVINTVNSIYGDQLGIKIILIDVKLDSGNRRSINSDDSEVVLDYFRNSLRKLNYLKKADIYHLFTGNRMAGSVVGLAYVGSTCRNDMPDYAVGLSRYTNPAVQPLITAHEIAHNLGATHVEGDDSIMSPVLTSNKTKFINYSFNQIQNYVNDFGLCLAQTTF